jgi:putative membrane protein
VNLVIAPLTQNIPALEWNWPPSVIAGLLAITLAYALAVGPLRGRGGWGPPVRWIRQAAFHTGTLLVFLALCSPLDELGDSYLFSAHMAQHMLLIYGAPPLWLVGLPGELLLRLFPPGARRKLVSWAVSPLPAFLLFNGMLAAWHIPAFYDAALQSERIHILEHLSFIGAAVIGWAPVLLAQPLNRFPAPGKTLYLFASSLACTGLAAVLTLSGDVLYRFYLEAPRGWGISALFDQQLGGLLMWLPGDMLFTLLALVIFGRWLAVQERARQAPTPHFEARLLAVARGERTEKTK